jgi:small conductance mechanosensitive channel
MEDETLRPLLLDPPSLMGVEKIELDTVTLRMVARTLPGKQFEVGRRLRLMVIAALTRAGIVTQSNTTPMVGAIVDPATEDGAEEATQGRAR